jgi:hypothetical protein
MVIMFFFAAVLCWWSLNQKCLTYIPLPSYRPSWQNAPVILKYPAYNWSVVKRKMSHKALHAPRWKEFEFVVSHSHTHTTLLLLAHAFRDLLGTPAYQYAAEKVLKNGRVLIKEAYLIPPYSDPVVAAEMNLAADWLRDYISLDQEVMEPVSSIYYPILDSMKQAVQVGGHAKGSDHAADDHVVGSRGLVALTIYWRDTINGILPPGSTGVVVVFDNPCNPSFSYQIDGPDVSYMGSGDLHDSKYNHLEQSMQLLESMQRDKTYSGLPVNSDYCPFTIRVLPSQAMQDDYMPNNPALFTVAAFLIFATTCAVFIIYDRWVEQRQRKVLQSALDATLNVCVLEQMVQERTRKLEATNQRLANANRKVRSASAAQLQHFASMSHEIRTPLNCIVVSQVCWWMMPV